MNHELSDVPAGFRKGRGTRDQIANIHWIIEKAREFQKNIYFCFIDYAKVLTMWITINCGKFWKGWEYQTAWQQLELDMAPPTQWTWVWGSSGSWWWTGRPDVLPVSASISVLPMNTQDWSPLGWTGWISSQSKDSQESSPAPQFKSINSSVVSFLYNPTLTSIHDYWKNHSLD